MNGRKNGSRFVFVCRVQLGTVHDTHVLHRHWTKAPDGAQSVRGVAGTVFPADEYVVYDVQQVRLAYLVEFVSHADVPKPQLAPTLAPSQPSLLKAALVHVGGDHCECHLGRRL